MDTLENQNKISALELRIEELLKEKYDLVQNLNYSETEVDRLKQCVLNLNTEMTAKKMSEWCLSDPEELYEIEQGINERNLLKKELDRKENVIRKLQYKNKIQANELDYYKGSFTMIREVLAKRSMVIHPWASKEVCDKQCGTDSKIIDDYGGFGMFESSPKYVKDCENCNHYGHSCLSCNY